ncbi:MAG: transporter, family, oxalate/formate antiporter [Thermoproteota archaeon]|nr:transporter, family, oxalate/formate antiporter [Thermoproteota archaeon]
MAENVKLFGMKAEKGRWILVIVGMSIQLCLGAIYSYSILNAPLRNYFITLGLDVTATTMQWPYIIFLLVFAVVMPLAGPYIEGYGPRKIAMVGGVLTGLGWFLASTATSPTSLAVMYGIVGGVGVGLAYSCPITVSTRWFPDRRGLAVGSTVLGFGFSAALIGPIADFLTANYGGILNTFRIFGIIFLIIIIILSTALVFPPVGWHPEGYVPPTPKTGSVVKAEFTRGEMVKTKSLFGLWICYTIGTLSGLMAIGIAKNVGLEVAASAGMASADASALMTTLIIPFAACNGFGRPIFGSITDKFKPRNTAMLSFILITIASLILYMFPSSIVLYTVSFALLWLCLGGWLAIAPTATATYFGTKDYPRNYGLVFTAYGVGAVTGNLLATQMKDIFGKYINVFPVVAGLAIVGIIVAFILLRPPKSAE